jgi:hypothetical protein
MFRLYKPQGYTSNGNRFDCTDNSIYYNFIQSKEVSNYSG